MNIDLHQLQFHLLTDPAHFHMRLEEMLHCIEEQLPGDTDHAHVLKKAKWVLTELVTNAYKHSGQPDMDISIYFGEENLRIVKYDYGRPLSLQLIDGSTMCWPLEETARDSRCHIFEDNLNALGAHIDAEGRATFFIEPKTASQQELREDMNEHFGLIIIARACEQFTYQYEAVSGKNVFTSVIRYE